MHFWLYLSGRFFRYHTVLSAGWTQLLTGVNYWPRWLINCIGCLKVDWPQWLPPYRESGCRWYGSQQLFWRNEYWSRKTCWWCLHTVAVDGRSVQLLRPRLISQLFGDNYLVTVQTVFLDQTTLHGTIYDNLVVDYNVYQCYNSPLNFLSS